VTAPVAPDRAAGPQEIVGAVLPAFGTRVGVWTTAASALPAAERTLRSWVAEVDAACSRFRPDSDLSRVNAGAGGPVEVSRLLVEALSAALTMAELTAGRCDPTLGTALIAAGYDRPFADIVERGPGPRRPPSPGGGWRDVRIDHRRSTVRVPPGVALDLGATAKGWAVDGALQRIRGALGTAHRATGLCVAAGGDLAVCGPAPGPGWPVLVGERLDVEGGDGSEPLLLAGGALATTGALVRRWGRGAEQAHHLIDPRTGAPAESPWRLVTVHAPTCLVAEAAATAAWLIGERAPAWLRRHRLGARLVARDGTVQPPVEPFPAAEAA
jgi:thiamine biosynthesis lipoprotein